MYLRAMYKRLWLFCLFGWGVSACSSGPQVEDSSVFRYNEPSGIASLDPAFAREQSAIWAVHQMFNGLVQLNTDLEVKPAIAESWSIDSSGEVYTFQLRKDVFYHPHGAFGSAGTRAVTADDVVFSLYRLIDSRTASPGGWILQNVDTLFAANSHELIIRLSEPFAPFLGLLTMKYCSVVPPEVVEAEGSEFGRRPIGTGPFAYKNWMPEEKLVLRRNAEYFEGKPQLEAVAISFIRDRQAAFMEFLKGNLDMLSGLDASYKDELLTRDGRLEDEYQDRYVLQKVPYLNTEYLAINCELPTDHPLADSRIRRALNWSIDREKLVVYLRNGVGFSADAGVIPRGLSGYQPELTSGFSYQPDSAMRLLDLAGYPGGRGMTDITLSTTSNYLDICEYLQSAWQKIGIPVQVEVLPPSTLREGKANASLPMFRASWIADYPDAENYMSLFYSGNHTPNGPNYTLFSNPAFDQLYESVRQSSSDSLRKWSFAEMEKLLLKEAPVVPLFYDEAVRFVSLDVEGLEPNALNLLELKAVSKSRK